MKKFKITTMFVSMTFMLTLLFIIPINVFAESTPEDGNWIAKYYYGGSEAIQNIVEKTSEKTMTDKKINESNYSIGHTSQADYVVRVGDVDDFGLGWVYTEENFFNRSNEDGDWTSIDPFSGKSTSAHYWGSGTDYYDTFQWDEINTNEPNGLDRIITVSSYRTKENESDIGADGYSNRRDKNGHDARRISPHNQNGFIDSEGTIDIDHNIKSIIEECNHNNTNFTVTAALLQMFVDDFQPKEGGSSAGGATYEVTFIDDNNKETRIPELENLINHLNQTGPIGKLISFEVPYKYLDLLKNNNHLKINIDDQTSGAGDGYAIDFVKLLINPKGIVHEGTISGKITDSTTGKGIENAYVVVNGKWKGLSDKDGNYEISTIISGLASVTAYKAGQYKEATKTVDVIDNCKSILDFQLEPIDKLKDLVAVKKTGSTNLGSTSQEEFEITMEIKNINLIKNNIALGKFTVTDEIADEFILIPTTLKSTFKGKDSSIAIKPVVENNNLTWNFSDLGTSNDIVTLSYRIKRRSTDTKAGKYPTSNHPALLTYNLTSSDSVSTKDTVQFPQVEVLLNDKSCSIIKQGLFIKNTVASKSLLSVSSSNTTIQIVNTFKQYIGIKAEINKETVNFKLNIDETEKLTNPDQKTKLSIYKVNGDELQLTTQAGYKNDVELLFKQINLSNFKFEKGNVYILVYEFTPIVEEISIKNYPKIEVINSVQLDNTEKQPFKMEVTDLPCLQ